MSKTDVCPSCKSGIDHDEIIIFVEADGSKTLHAHCDTCGWDGIKTMKAVTL